MNKHEEDKFAAEQMGFTQAEYRDYLLGKILEEDKIDPYYLVDSKEEALAILNQGAYCTHQCPSCGTGIFRLMRGSVWAWMCLNRQCLKIYSEDNGKPNLE